MTKLPYNLIDMMTLPIEFNMVQRRKPPLKNVCSWMELTEARSLKLNHAKLASEYFNRKGI